MEREYARQLEWEVDLHRPDGARVTSLVVRGELPRSLVFDGGIYALQIDPKYPCERNTPIYQLCPGSARPRLATRDGKLPAADFDYRARPAS